MYCKLSMCHTRAFLSWGANCAIIKYRQRVKKVKSLSRAPSTRRAALISVSLALGQTPAFIFTLTDHGYVASAPCGVHCTHCAYQRQRMNGRPIFHTIPEKNHHVKMFMRQTASFWLSSQYLSRGTELPNSRTRIGRVEWGLVDLHLQWVE